MEVTEWKKVWERNRKGRWWWNEAITGMISRSSQSRRYGAESKLGSERERERKKSGEKTVQNWSQQRDCRGSKIRNGFQVITLWARIGGANCIYWRLARWAWNTRLTTNKAPRDVVSVAIEMRHILKFFFFFFFFATNNIFHSQVAAHLLCLPRALAAFRSIWRTLPLCQPIHFILFMPYHLLE